MNTTASQTEGTGDAEAPDPVEGAAGAPEVTEGTEETATDTKEGGSREARYRTERNEARAERDALQTRLETLQRGEVERLAEQHLAAGDAVWLGGAELTSQLDSDGNVDPEAVRATCEALGASRPYLLAQQTGADLVGLGATGGAPTGQPSWGEALAGTGRR